MMMKITAAKNVSVISEKKIMDGKEEPTVITAAEATQEVLRFQKVAYGVAIGSHLSGILEIADAIGNKTRMISATMRTIPQIVGVSIEGGRPLRRNNPLYGNIIKVQRASGPTGFVWESVVNRQRRREKHPDYFYAEARPWKSFIDGSPLFMHNGRREDKETGEVFWDNPKRGMLYLPMMVQSYDHPTYYLYPGPAQLEVDLDTPIQNIVGETRTLRRWLYKRPESPRGGTQDLNKPREYIGIYWRNVINLRGLEKGTELHFID